MGRGRFLIGVMAVALLLAWPAGDARAQTKVVLQELLGSWEGDDEIQYVELRMADAGQNVLAGVAALVFDDATASVDNERTFIFTQNPANGVADGRILIGTTKVRDLGNVALDDLPLPTGYFSPKGGRVCYAVNEGRGFVPIDCVSYGDFTGDTFTFGAPTTITPDNRVLRRNALTGKNRADWIGALDPMPTNNAGAVGQLPATLCGDGIISQGEECDGKALAGATCTSLGFAKGKLVCTQCHFDTSKCTTCGNGVVQGKEECDGGDLGDRTCDSLGYVGGTLACTDTCTITTAGCDPVFFAPGGGPAKTDCLGEWRIASAHGGPNAAGKVAARQKCTDGDPGCDADGTANGTCTFTVAACLARTDARLPKCTPPAVSGWALVGKIDPTSPPAVALVGAVAALGPSTVDGLAVTFAPPLAAADDCTANVAVAVPAGKTLVLRTRITGPGGKPRDADALRLGCTR